MANISVSLPSDGDTIDVADYNTPINTIVSEINGGLDNSNISATAAIAGTKLADGSVTNAKLAANTAWTAFTPTWTNLTPGSGTNTGRWTQIGKLVVVQTEFIFGAGSALGTQPTIALPVNASGNSLSAAVSPIGLVGVLDSGTAQFTGSVLYGSTTTAIYLVGGTGGTYATPTTITSSVPMTWAAGDKLTGFFTYEAA